MTYALIAAALTAAGWFAIRWQEETRRIDKLIATVLTTPLSDPEEDL